MVCCATYAAKKPYQAIVNLISYDKTGEVLASGNGFFISSEGKVVVPYQLLKNAFRAEVIDTKGKRYEVARVVGANSTYDLAVLTITAKKPKFEYFNISKDSVVVGASLTTYPYSAKKAKPIAVSVDSVMPYDSLCYYSTSVPNEKRYVGCPLLNEAGEVVAVVQSNVKDSAQTSFAIDARFVPTLRTKAMSSWNTDLRNIRIPKQLPENEQEALSYLLMLDMADSLCTITAHQDFIATYPNNPDGYMNHASFSMVYGQYEQCEEFVNRAFEVAEKKGEVHYAFSKMLYQMVRGGVKYKDWTAEMSANEAAQAYALDSLPLYRQQEAHSRFLAGQFKDAQNCFQDVCKTDLVSAETHYLIAKCMLLTGSDTLAIIAQMDSALNYVAPPIPKSQAFMVLERANLLYEAGLYRRAVMDYNAYEGIMTPRLLTDRFYALRSQVELSAKMYQQALDDMLRARLLAPEEAFYPQECARIYLVTGNYDEAIRYAQESINLKSDNAEAYKILGLAHRQLGNKQVAKEILQKAKELGDDSVTPFLD